MTGPIYLESDERKRRPFKATLLVAGVAALALWTLSIQVLFPFPSPHLPPPPSLHPDDIAACEYDAQRLSPSSSTPRSRINPRPVDHAPFVIRNASVIDGTGARLGAKDLVIVNGTITKIVPVGQAHHGWKEVDLEGRFLTPGIVDMHSHVGGRSLPQYTASEDVTEISAPVTPQMKAIDGFDPSDEGIPAIRAGGVTTSLLLTGASNMLSGQGLAIKMRDMPGFSIAEMAVQAHDPPSVKRLQYLKMACGENPKSKGLVFTRLGEAAALREAFAGAKALREAQDDWCANPSSHKGRYPRDVKLQFLAEVLRGDVNVNVHCYKTEDIEMMFRLADEAGFNITALHHASETYRMIETLKKHQPLTLAIFGGEYGFKPETMLNSVNNGALMNRAGFNVSYVSDHPALNGQFPMREAAMAYNFGLEEEAAIASVFAVPAVSIGLGDRLGRVQEGYDADLVVWDDHPLQVGATPLQVWIDGIEQIKESPIDAWTASQVGRPAPPQRGLVGAAVESACRPNARDLVLRDVDVSLHSAGKSKSISSGATHDVVVRDGHIVCVGDCSKAMHSALQDGVAEMRFSKTAFLTQGLTQLTPMHGLTEMLMEPSSSDGFVSGTDIHVSHAHYALTTAGIHVKIANMVGITTIITAPRAKGPAILERIAMAGFIRGISMAFRTGIKHAAEPDAFVKKDVAMHVTLGHAAKSSFTPTIASQVGTLRKLLASPPDEDWEAVANGTLVLAIQVDSADIMAQIVLIKEDFPSVKPVLIGAAESWMIADRLAEADIAVVLAPWRCMALDWEQRRCHHGVPLEETTSVSILLEAGVRLGLASADDKGVRNMWWEAGWASKVPSLRNSSLSRYNLAVDLLSTNVNEIFGLDVDETSSFSVWEGNPFEYGAVPAVIFDGGKVNECYPGFDVLPWDPVAQ